MPVKLFLKKAKGKVNKKVIKYTLDDKLLTFLDEILFAKKAKQTKEISIIDVITDKEAAMFAKINKIKFKPNHKNKELSSMLDTLEKKYPEIRFSLSKSVSELKK